MNRQKSKYRFLLILKPREVMYMAVAHKGNCPFQEKPKIDGDVVWCKPEKTCNVEYMPNTLDALRQPVFKGIMDDV